MDQRRRALTVRLAELQIAAGDVRAAQATGRSAGMAATDCRRLQRIVWRLPSNDDNDFEPLAPLPFDPYTT